MSKVEVNTVEPQCGTTLTLGGSGDTVALGSGASQTGFGRTGTVDWQTGSIKTTTFTAVNGEGYFVNTAGGAVTCNLPAGTAGAIVSFSDYTNTWQNDAFTITPNGTDKIGGVNANVSLNTEGQSVTLVYVDGTEGWKNVQDSTSNVIGASFICASVSGTCNTLATCGSFKIATFKNPGTFTVNSVSLCAPYNIVDYVVVAGGGGGGSGCGAGGAGGGGGFRFFANPDTPQSGPGSPRNGYTPNSPSPAPSGTQITVTATPYAIAVGGGGPGGPGGPGGAGNGSSGVDSSFSTVTSTGGGGGAGGNTGCAAAGQPGGSGGGMARNRPGSAGSGNTPPTTPPQGSPGAKGSNPLAGDGGGGAICAGSGGQPTPNPSHGYGGNGGDGAGITGFGTTGELCAAQYYFSGGGGGGTYMACAASPAPGSQGRAGKGGGGLGGNACGVPNQPSGDGEAGTVNTGGGGGGGTEITGSPSNPTTNDGNGGNGGSGIVIIKYRFQA